eukprot:scaffold336_cov384-Prasinococcus_capsulatus_cf.AAC.30
MGRKGATRAPRDDARYYKGARRGAGEAQKKEARTRRRRPPRRRAASSERGRARRGGVAVGRGEGRDAIGGSLRHGAR